MLQGLLLKGMGLISVIELVTATNIYLLPTPRLGKYHYI